MVYIYSIPIMLMSQSVASERCLSLLEMVRASSCYSVRWFRTAHAPAQVMNGISHIHKYKSHIHVKFWRKCDPHIVSFRAMGHSWVNCRVGHCRARSRTRTVSRSPIRTTHAENSRLPGYEYRSIIRSRLNPPHRDPSILPWARNNSCLLVIRVQPPFLDLVCIRNHLGEVFAQVPFTVLIDNYVLTASIVSATNEIASA